MFLSKKSSNKGKKEQILQEFENVTGPDGTGVAFILSALFTGFIVKGVQNLFCSMLGINNPDTFHIIPILGGISNGMKMGDSYAKSFEERRNNNAFTKCNEYKLSADECYDTLKQSKQFQKLFYDYDPKYKNPQEFKRDYNKYLNK